MKAKTKRIISITSLCLVMTLIAVVIILAVIPTYKGITFYNSDGKFTVDDRPDVITIRTGGNKELQLYNGNETDQAMYDKLWDAYDNAGTYSVFDSIFIGISAKEPYAERLDKTSSAMSTLFDASGEYCMIFTWYDSREMMNADGTRFTYNVGGNDYDSPAYARAYLSITSDDVITKTPVYLLESSRDFKSGTTRYVYNGYFNTSALYQLLASLEYQNV
ncbi:MAG: hypothetical protein IKC79_01630 [Clostridia bacterium]|nr:hypothetical protein [Clostridia bacterium]